MKTMLMKMNSSIPASNHHIETLKFSDSSAKVNNATEFRDKT